jgi:hypothetical protein
MVILSYLQLPITKENTTIIVLNEWILITFLAEALPFVGVVVVLPVVVVVVVVALDVSFVVDGVVGAAAGSDGSTFVAAVGLAVGSVADEGLETIFLAATFEGDFGVALVLLAATLAATLTPLTGLPYHIIHSITILYRTNVNDDYTIRHTCTGDLAATFGGII